MQSRNPLQRRIEAGTEADILQIAKMLIEPQYHSCKNDLSIFALHPGRQINKKTGKEWNHAYDKNAAYPGVMATVKLGVGEPIHVKQSYPIQFPDTLLPGIWLIELDAKPFLSPLDFVPYGKSWQYTPTIEYLLQNHIRFACWEGWYFSDGKRLLWKLYNYLKDWREHDKEAAKEAYTHLFGLLAHKPDTLYPGCLYRPDFLGTIISESNVRMHKAAMQAYKETGCYPTSWKVDCLYYEQACAWFDSRLGTGIGEWKHVKNDTKTS